MIFVQLWAFSLHYRAGAAFNKAALGPAFQGLQSSSADILILLQLFLIFYRVRYIIIVFIITISLSRMPILLFLVTTITKVKARVSMSDTIRHFHFSLIKLPSFRYYLLLRIAEAWWADDGEGQSIISSENGMGFRLFAIVTSGLADAHLVTLSYWHISNNTRDIFKFRLALKLSSKVSARFLFALRYFHFGQIPRASAYAANFHNTHFRYFLASPRTFVEI